MLFDITPIVQAAIVLLAAVVTTVVVPYIKSRTTADQQQQINTWVKIAVAAVEQTGKGIKGAEKKEKVLTWLHEHGVAVDESQLDIMIEAAVFDLKNGVIPVSTGILLESGAAHE